MPGHGQREYKVIAAQHSLSLSLTLWMISKHLNLHESAHNTSTTYCRESIPLLCVRRFVCHLHVYCTLYSLYTGEGRSTKYLCLHACNSGHRKTICYWHLHQWSASRLSMHSIRFDLYMATGHYIRMSYLNSKRPPTNLIDFIDCDNKTKSSSHHVTAGFPPIFVCVNTTFVEIGQQITHTNTIHSSPTRESNFSAKLSQNDERMRHHSRGSGIDGEFSCEST